MEFRYEDLVVGEIILELIDLVCSFTAKFPSEEKWILVSQIRRSVNSVYLNLAEGSARRSYKDFARFLTIATGSLIETHAGLKLSYRRGYLNTEEMKKSQILIEDIWFRLIKLRQTQLEKNKS